MNGRLAAAAPALVLLPTLTTAAGRAMRDRRAKAAGRGVRGAVKLLLSVQARRHEGGGDWRVSQSPRHNPRWAGLGTNGGREGEVSHDPCVDGHVCPHTQMTDWTIDVEQLAIEVQAHERVRVGSG